MFFSFGASKTPALRIRSKSDRLAVLTVSKCLIGSLIISGDDRTLLLEISFQSIREILLPDQIMES